jgi:hypothetical protein
MLSADKGEHRIEELEGKGPPGIARHGAVSFAVNYHAFVRTCEEAGGLPLLPRRRHKSVDVIGLLMVPDARRHERTRHAYAHHVHAFGPDDFFRMTGRVRRRLPLMSAREILDFIALSRHDSRQFGRVMARLAELADDLDDATRAEIRNTADAVWERHYSIGDGMDLGWGIAHLLYALDDYAGALLYFERSTSVYGADSGTLYNMACCRHLLGRDAEAAATLDLVMRHDPDNAGAQALRSVCSAAA